MPYDIHESAIIGEGCKIHHTAIIGPGVTIGANCFIGPYCIIGEPPEMREGWPMKSAGVIIGPGSVLTGAVTIDGGTVMPTRLSEQCLLMKRVHVGHDAEIEKRVTLSVGCMIGGKATIMTGAVIGLGASIHQYKVVPPYSMVGMLAAVTMKTKMRPFATYAGVPATEIGLNKVGIKRLQDGFGTTKEYNGYAATMINEYEAMKAYKAMLFDNPQINP